MEATDPLQLPGDFLARQKQFHPERPAMVLWVRIAPQRMHWFERRPGESTWGAGGNPIIVSTSRFGIGQEEGSQKTPLGLHRIAEKIGAGCEPGTAFKGRRAIGHVRDLPDARITDRILWLEGLEPGFNRGGHVDSHQRYIYIHGTADQAGIGRPDSCGCIHVATHDLIPLFDLVPVGTLVWISEE